MLEINWSTFWSALLGTSIPSFIFSLVLLWLNHRNNKTIESYKTDMATKLAQIQNEYQTQNVKLTLWHQKRVQALIDIYDAFRKHLDFLRKALYVPSKASVNMDPMHEFHLIIEEKKVYLDDDLQKKILSLQGQLLEFWNWAMKQPRGKGISGDSVQIKLDHEIPGYLDILRKEINNYADPKYEPS